MVGSFLLHAVLIGVTALLISSSDAHQKYEHVVYTVSIEGGQSLGGVNQAPDEEDYKAPKVKTFASAQGSSSTLKKSNGKIDFDKPTFFENDPIKKSDERKKLEQKKLAEQKALELKKKKEAEERKKLEQKRKEEERKKKEAEEAKKKKELEAKKAADKKAEQEAKEKKIRDDALAKKAARDELLRNATSQYKGESVDAGGEGFGAAKLGGNSMGGGIKVSPEYKRYEELISRHIKSSWVWLSGTQKLFTRVEVSIAQNGQILNVSIVSSSGNSNFDNSVVRAVYKSSPVPAPSEEIYPYFKTRVFRFDSDE